ncbi:MAG: hypothetical protein ACI9K4_001696, partial [Polaribacter sp.]
NRILYAVLRSLLECMFYKCTIRNKIKMYTGHTLFDSL